MIRGVWFRGLRVARQLVVCSARLFTTDCTDFTDSENSQQRTDSSLLQILLRPIREIRGSRLSAQGGRIRGWVRDQAPRYATALALVLLAGCTTVRDLWRPEGDGGYSRAERRAAVSELAPVAGVVDPQAAATPAPTAAVYDLRAALDAAGLANRAVRAADVRQQIARRRALEARGLLFPTTTAGARYTWFSDVQSTTARVPAGAISPGVPPTDATFPVVLSDSDAATVNAQILLPLDLSGEIRQTLAAAQAGYRGEAARRWATELEADLDVTRAYFDRLAAQRLREVTEQTIALYQRQLHDADERFRAGRLTKNEVLEVQVVLRNAEQRKVQEDVLVDRTRWAFNQAIGVAIDAPTEVVDVRVRPELPPIDETLRAAQEKNPVLTSLFERQRQLEAEQSALERSRFPRFEGGGAMNYSSSDLFTPNQIGSGFVGFRWDLGTDTQREERIAAARLAVDENHVQLEAELRRLEQALRATQRAAEERLSALDTAEVAVGQAEENLRIRQQQFGAGRAQTRDVLDAQRLLAEQRAVLATALYDAQTRRAELQQLMGEPFDALLADRKE
jgi:outer membrane protein TolC